MRIRWKTLLLLLLISILPMLVMRWKGHHVIQELGDDLALRTRSALTHQATLALKRLVEDHARVLKREAALIMLSLHLQASEVEKKLFSPPGQTGSGIFERFADADSNKNMLSEQYCSLKGNGECSPMTVSYSDQTVSVPTGMASDDTAAVMQRLSSMVPVYRELNNKHQGLFLWQLTALDNGVQSIYPAVGHIPVYDILQTEWYQAVKEKNEAMWGRPRIDPLTKKIVFPIAIPLHNARGVFCGVTAVMYPVSVALHENEHIRMLSENVISLLVRPVRMQNSEDTAIRIIASEDGQPTRHRGWRFMTAPQWLRSPDRKPLHQMTSDLLDFRAGVREISYQKEESLMAYSPISSNGVFLLLIAPKADLVREANAMEQYVQKRFEEDLKITRAIFLLVVLSVVCLSLILSRYVTRNIQKLADASGRLAAGDFSARVDIRTKDEIGEFGRRFNRMVPALEERFRMKQGLEFASNVQQNLLPRSPPEMKGVEIAATSIYCDETGGDFYDFIRLHRGHAESIGVAVGDVSGHGISAALLMATARAFLRCRVGQPGTLTEMITEVNRLLCQDTRVTNQFMTLFYAEIIPEDRTLSWIRAGHDPAMLYDPAKDVFTELMGRGMALGIDSDFLYAENHLENLEKGQVLVIGTDGIWETHNPDGEMFGKARLRDLIRLHGHQSAREILDAVTRAIHGFQETASREDDITLVIVRIIR
ncbi:phosphatase [Desulfonema ishimotonii]|uniref:Phosphatase n=1 Tax=Desulfonema ishimotonii TaxID=45657 RepID=A0A401G3D8_9BACT|nr:SpoIIE family protein phosphatase [Desulfonema ishimotonii]GBC63734.1 phosphatase [Desulfonema ishimotonii]